MTDDRGWAMLTADDGIAHVVPVEGPGDEEPAAGHELRASCPCQPSAIRDAPLDAPALSHREPSWPGARVGPD